MKACCRLYYIRYKGKADAESAVWTYGCSDVRGKSQKQCIYYVKVLVKSAVCKAFVHRLEDIPKQGRWEDCIVCCKAPDL